MWAMRYLNAIFTHTHIQENTHSDFGLFFFLLTMHCFASDYYIKPT